jgi:hypothetical protein
MLSRSKIRRIRRPSFNINGCATLWTVALKRPIFKRKKGFATISLRLNNCTMGSSWPRSRDTVPLITYCNLVYIYLGVGLSEVNAAYKIFKIPEYLLHNVRDVNSITKLDKQIFIFFCPKCQLV